MSKKKPIGCLLVFILPLALLAISMSIDSARIHNRIAEFDTCDHEALLAACREMIAHRDDYRKSPSYEYSTIDPDNVLLSPQKSVFGDEIPEIIRSLRPFYVFIKSDSVIITGHYSGLTGGARIGVVGFAEGAKQYGTYKYIEGLWYWNGHRSKDNDQAQL